MVVTSYQIIWMDRATRVNRVTKGGRELSLTHGNHHVVHGGSLLSWKQFCWERLSSECLSSKQYFCLNMTMYFMHCLSYPVRSETCERPKRDLRETWKRPEPEWWRLRALDKLELDGLELELLTEPKIWADLNFISSTIKIKY